MENETIKSNEVINGNEVENLNEVFESMVELDKENDEEVDDGGFKIFEDFFKLFGTNDASQETIEFELLNDDATLPEYAHDSDSGMDVRSCEDTMLNPGEFKLVHTGLKVKIPKDYAEIQVRPRSGMALKHGVTVLNTPGTIDAGYRGEIGVILINHSRVPYTIHKGDKIAQLVVVGNIMHYKPVISEIESDTERGDGGFGSTGK